jgi:hypothetical protein
MDNIYIYIIGGIFSAFSGFITWMSWKDTRASFSMIAKLDRRIEALEEMAGQRPFSNYNRDQFLKS